LVQTGIDTTEDGGSMILQNVGISRHYMAPEPRRPRLKCYKTDLMFQAGPSHRIYKSIADGKCYSNQYNCKHAWQYNMG